MGRRRTPLVVRRDRGQAPRRPPRQEDRLGSHHRLSHTVTRVDGQAGRRLTPSRGTRPDRRSMRPGVSICSARVRTIAVRGSSCEPCIPRSSCSVSRPGGRIRHGYELHHGSHRGHRRRQSLLATPGLLGSSCPGEVQGTGASNRRRRAGHAGMAGRRAAVRFHRLQHGAARRHEGTGQHAGAALLRADARRLLRRQGSRRVAGRARHLPADHVPQHRRLQQPDVLHEDRR